MFFAARDVPKPRSPEEMVRNYRHSAAERKEWVEGAGAGGRRARASGARRAGAPGGGVRRRRRPGPLGRRLGVVWGFKPASEGNAGCTSAPYSSTYRARARATMTPQIN